MIKSVNRVALGQSCEIGKVSLCFSPSTLLPAKQYNHPRAEVPYLVPGECYSLPAVTVETPADKYFLYLSANGGPVVGAF